MVGTTHDQKMFERTTSGYCASPSSAREIQVFILKGANHRAEQREREI
jgi:hypothetical protein